jgi:hypothetical protein
MAPEGGRGGHHGGGARARFEQANTTHDGRLTMQQAQAAGWQQVVRHFGQIDRDQKGYVTIQDIREFHRERRQERTGGGGPQGGAGPQGGPPPGAGGAPPPGYGPAPGGAPPGGYTPPQGGPPPGGQGAAGMPAPPANMIPPPDPSHPY